MLPSSPNIRQTTNLNINDFTPNTITNQNQIPNTLSKHQTTIKQHQTGFSPLDIHSSPQKAFQLNLTSIMKNNENYEMSLASNGHLAVNSAQRDFYSQTQRSLMQNPIVLNPEQFNNSNNAKGSRINEMIAGAGSANNISQEKLKDVN